MGELRDKIGCGLLERDFERRFIHGARAQSLHGEFALVDPFRVLQRIKDIGIRRAGPGRHQATEREDKVFRHDLVAIRPFRVAAKLKIINRAAGIDRPPRRDAWNDFAPRIERDKSLEKFIENTALDQGCRLVRIERSRIAKLAAMPNHFGRCAIGTSGLRGEARSEGKYTDGHGVEKKAEQAAVPAGPPAQSKRTLCCATGICARIFFTRSGSIRVETMPTPSEALAMTWPQGSTAREWP